MAARGTRVAVLVGLAAVFGALLVASGSSVLAGTRSALSCPASPLKAGAVCVHPVFPKGPVETAPLAPPTVLPCRIAAPVGTGADLGCPVPPVPQPCPKIQPASPPSLIVICRIGPVPPAPPTVLPCRIVAPAGAGVNLECPVPQPCPAIPATSPAGLIAICRVGPVPPAVWPGPPAPAPGPPGTAPCPPPPGIEVPSAGVVCPALPQAS